MITSALFMGEHVNKSDCAADKSANYDYSYENERRKILFVVKTDRRNVNKYLLVVRGVGTRPNFDACVGNFLSR